MVRIVMSVVSRNAQTVFPGNLAEYFFFSLSFNVFFNQLNIEGFVRHQSTFKISYDHVMEDAL